MQESGEISMCFEVNDYADITTFNLFYDSGIKAKIILNIRS